MAHIESARREGGSITSSIVAAGKEAIMEAQSCVRVLLAMEVEDVWIGSGVVKIKMREQPLDRKSVGRI